MRELPHLIGDFTWTGWDYLGEAGIGRMRYASDDITRAEAGSWGSTRGSPRNCGDVDITGFRLPVSYWREIVWGLRDAPYVAVRPPAHHGERRIRHRCGRSPTRSRRGRGPAPKASPSPSRSTPTLTRWSSWSTAARPARAAVGDAHPYLATIDTTYTPGELTAVAYRNGSETGRCSLVSASGPVQLDVQVDRARIDATDRDLAYIAIALVDAAGTVLSGEDRAVTVEVDGPAVLQGLGSGNPCSEETFAAPTHDTFNGRALAVVRPTGAGTITVTVSAKDCDDRTLTIEAAPS